MAAVLLPFGFLYSRLFVFLVFVAMYNFIISRRINYEFV